MGVDRLSRTSMIMLLDTPPSGMVPNTTLASATSHEPTNLSEMPNSSLRLAELLSYTYRFSQYYQNLWREVDFDSCVKLEALPQVDHTSFWDANTLTGNTVLTGEQQSGIIMKTGGTTGKPKLSFWTNEEFTTIAKSLALCLQNCGVLPAHRLANLFYAGDLYGSFLLHILSVYELNVGIQIPVAGHIAPEDMIRHLADFETEVILSTVTTVSKLAGILRQENRELPFVRKLLFSGEALYDDQIAQIREAFPNADVQSLVYGTMESGVIGIPAQHPDTRVHQLNPGMILEILTNEGPTSAVGVPGELVVTNLTRRLMPIIRYSCGDQGEWVNYDEGLFRLLGRQSKSVRLGPVSLDISHIRSCVGKVLDTYQGLQAVLKRHDSKDEMVLRIACSNVDPEFVSIRVINELYRERPMLKEHIENGLIGPVRILCVPQRDLVINHRSGKAIEVIDERLQ